MTALACLLFLAAPNAVNLVDQIYEIPAGDWRYVPLVELRRQPAQVRAEFEVRSGPPVRLLLMQRGDMERLSKGQPNGQIQATSPERAATLNVDIGHPGEYVLVVDNRSSAQAARVHLKVSFDYGGAAELPRSRQLTVIVISLSAFTAIVAYASWRLWAAVRN